MAGLLERARGPLALLLAASVGCAPGPPQVKPSIDPGDSRRPHVVVPGDSAARGDSNLAREAGVAASPREAFAREWMPLRATGVDEFRRRYPNNDGRGVLLAILDSGLDPGIPGLIATTAGDRKILELRDFSREGRITLEPVRPRGDSVQIAGRWFRGFGRVVALNNAGPYYGGALAELSLGSPPAADLDGNGSATDTLALLVTRASDGWVLLVDSDRDGSFANERAVHDYSVAKEYWGWHTGGRPARMDFAANLSDSGGKPRLDLFFDSYGHGTHVAGIAAGHDLYDIKGFDGVAPGAHLIGLKIANDAQGGVTVTGSIVRAMDYAIRFASARNLPLVMSLSFGVGNEPEVMARIDQLVDSILTDHPEVVLCVSAGNDGPGLSSLDSPASATRVLSVGATLSGGFRAQAAEPDPDPVWYFSSRGGRYPKPDLVVPGIAYSAVPRWDAGNEVKQGTSMAAPHAAGLVADLLSGLIQDHRRVPARVIRQALMVTARPMEGNTMLDEGTGVPDLGAAFRWLKSGKDVPDLAVRAKRHGFTAAYRPDGLESESDTVQEFEVTRLSGPAAVTYTLKSDAPWLFAPGTVRLSEPITIISLRYRAAALRAPGVYTGEVTGWSSDTLAGPLFRLLNTVVVPYPAGETVVASFPRIGLGGVRRVFFRADSARPFAVNTRTSERWQQVLTFLHGPDGQPWDGESGTPVPGFGEFGARLVLDGRDVLPGAYEAVAVGWSPQDQGATIEIVHSPVIPGVRRAVNGVAVSLTNVAREPVTAKALLGLVGGEREIRIVARGSEAQRIPFVIPAWASFGLIDLSLEPEQWARFTDFGVTLFDSVGRQLGKQPMGHAVSRLEVDLSRTLGSDRPAVLGLLPGFAEPEHGEPWSARVSIRLYADSAHVIRLESQELTVAPGASVERVLNLPRNMLPLGDAFFPLGLLLTVVEGRAWTREVGLPAPPPPLAR